MTDIWSNGGTFLQLPTVCGGIHGVVNQETMLFRLKRSKFVAAIAALGLALTACGSDAEDEGSGDATGGDNGGSSAFNTVKGSIPARSDLTDEEIAEFGPYQQDAMESFANDTIVSSIAHGAAVPVAVSNAMNDACAKFIQGASDLETFQQELAEAAAPLSQAGTLGRCFDGCAAVTQGLDEPPRHSA